MEVLIVAIILGVIVTIWDIKHAKIRMERNKRAENKKD
jgi:hypothetical protein